MKSGKPFLTDVRTLRACIDQGAVTLSGAAGGIRTHDIQNHNLALLPTELQPPRAYSV